MIIITLENVQAGIAALPDGSKRIAFLDPQSGIQVVATFTEEGAREIAAGLGSGIVVARDNGEPPR